jgi:hypothetical protein
MLLSQPAAGTAKEQFVDLAPHLQPALQETGKYTIVVYHRSISALQEAVKAGKLKAMDLEPPVGRDAAHRIASVLGTGGILHISATNTKDGVTGAAELEVLVGQNTWNQVYIDQIAAAKQGGKRVSLLEGIHGIVDRVVQKMTTANVQVIGAQRPVEPPKNGLRGKTDNPATPGDASKPGDTPKPGDTVKPPAKAEPAAGDGGKAATGTAAPGNATAQTPDPRPPRVDNASTYALLIDRSRRNGDMASLIVALRKAINERPHDIHLRRDLAAVKAEIASV